MDRHSVHQVSFNTRPSKLFEGAEQRLTIYIQSPSNYPRLFSGGCQKWFSDERSVLFPRIHYSEVPIMQRRNAIWPKVEGDGVSVFNKLACMKPLKDSGLLGNGAALYYKNTGLRYYNTVTTRPPRCWINGVETASSRQTILTVNSEHQKLVHALLLSSTFFLYYQATSNCRDLNPSDIAFAPVPDVYAEQEVLDRLSIEIEADYIGKSRLIKMNNKLTGLVELESLTPAKSKAFIDRIDRVLAHDYGFSDEELDFIINYDIKYRMGRGGEDEGEE